MGKYEELLIEHDNINVIETNKLPEFQSGLYINGQIFIKDDISTYQKHAVLAEEIAHSKYTYGNILDQSNTLNKKLELFARRKAYESVISLQGLIDAYNNGISNIHEMADFFEVNLGFAQECLNHYKSKYGISVKYDKYIIEFEPLNIYKD